MSNNTAALFNQAGKYTGTDVNDLFNSDGALDDYLFFDKVDTSNYPGDSDIVRLRYAQAASYACDGAVTARSFHIEFY